MIARIGIVIFQILSFVAFTAGLFSLFEASSVPGNYFLYDASAVQVTQVYSEATFVMLRAIAYILVAIFIQIALYIGYFRKDNDNDLEVIVENTETIRGMVAKIGGIIQRSNRSK